MLTGRRGEEGRKAGGAAAAQQQGGGERGEQRPRSSTAPPAARLGGHLGLPIYRVAMEVLPANERAEITDGGGAEAAGDPDWVRLFQWGEGGREGQGGGELCGVMQCNAVQCNER